jgi:hypothetical protein
VAPRDAELLERIDLSREIFSLTKNRTPDPSEIPAPEFKGEIRRSAICLVSQAVDIDWSIFLGVLRKSSASSLPKKIVSDGDVRRPSVVWPSRRLRYSAPFAD